MHPDIEAMAAEAKRLREDRKRFDIEQLIAELRGYSRDGFSSPSFDLDTNQAVERVRKFLDDHR